MTVATRAVVVHPDAETLAHAAAARLLTTILDRLSVQETVHIVLTGGTVGIKALAAIAASPLARAVDWSAVHLWWGDERFLPDGDPERNETQAREALLDSLEALVPAHVHAMPAPGSAGVSTPEESAAAYAAELARFAPVAGSADESGAEGAGAAAGTGPAVLHGRPAVPTFDVVLFGMGPDGHIASLFPGHEALGASGTVVGVHGSPKPPPQRVSLTFDAIGAAREVWLLVAGAEKAPAVARALSGAPRTEIPAGTVTGTHRTLWLLDAPAATP